jgi:hypothetical protein
MLVVYIRQDFLYRAVGFGECLFEMDLIPEDNGRSICVISKVNFRTNYPKI